MHLLRTIRSFSTIAFIVLLASVFSGCATNGDDPAHIEGESSVPVNKHEETQYKQALIRCHKTGGSRIVKINGELRCY